MEFITGLNVAPFAVVLVFIVFDVISGIIKGGATGTISSQKMREGLWHKSAIILLEAVASTAYLASQFVDGLPQEFGAIYMVASVYIVVMETVSILENVAIANPELAGGRLYEIFGVNNHDQNDWGNY